MGNFCPCEVDRNEDDGRFKKLKADPAPVEVDQEEFFFEK